MPGTSPIAGDIVETRTLCATIDQIGLNVIHWRTAVVANGGVTLAELAERIDADVAAVYRNWIGSTATYRGVGARNLTGDLTIEYHAVTRQGPGLVGGILPGQVSGLIALQTLSAGRHFRGRIYPPFPNGSSANSAGEMIPGAVLNLEAIAAAYGIGKTISVGIRQSVFAMCILHRSTLARPIPPASRTTDVSNTVTRSRWATQRRRGDFGETNIPPF
jgi:hypothetical protein